jgi:four helix bundle protein
MAHEPDICQRTFEFACRIVRLCHRLVVERGEIGRLVTRQLLRAGTSIGANVEEAQGGQSKPDFISKTCIALKEARETRYWLRVVEATIAPPPSDTRPLAKEATELVAILTAIVVKARSSPRRGPG